MVDFPTYSPNSLIEELPEYIKDPINYKKIQIALLETLATKHSHSEMVEWAECPSCMRKLRDHADMMKQLGFKTPAHYQAWQKTHKEMERIANKLGGKYG